MNACVAYRRQEAKEQCVYHLPLLCIFLWGLAKKDLRYSERQWINILNHIIIFHFTYPSSFAPPFWSLIAESWAETSKLGQTIRVPRESLQRFEVRLK